MRHSFYLVISRERIPDVLYVMLSRQFDKCLLEEQYNLSTTDILYQKTIGGLVISIVNIPSLGISLLSTQYGPCCPSLIMLHYLWPLSLTQVLVCDTDWANKNIQSLGQSDWLKTGHLTHQCPWDPVKLALELLGMMHTFFLFLLGYLAIRKKLA